MNLRTMWFRASLVLGLGAAVACSFDAPPGLREIDVRVEGLWEGASLSLSLDPGGSAASETLTITENGDFSFEARIPEGGMFVVAEQVAPIGHTCAIAESAGTVGSDDPLVVVTCAGPEVDIAPSLPISWAFEPTQLEYDVPISLLAQEVSFQVTADAATSISINDEALGSGVASARFPLRSGENRFTVVVEVETVSRTYSIALQRGGIPIDGYVYAKSEHPDVSDELGGAVDVSDDAAIVGVSREDSGLVANPEDESLSDSGAALVFDRTGEAWSEAAYLKAPEPDINDRFGFSVAVSGDTVAIGAPFEDSAATGINGDDANDAAADAGAVYVFTRRSGTWQLDAYLKASNTDAGDRFGHAVALSGDALVVGAPGEDSSASGVDGDQSNNVEAGNGAAYVFRRSGAAWSQDAYLKPVAPAFTSEGFGESVAIDGDVIAVGATQAQVAYVFRRTSTWAHEGTLGAGGGAVLYGSSIAVSGAYIAVAAVEDNEEAGTVFMYRRDGLWQADGTLRAPAGAPGHRFGWTVSLAGDLLAVAELKEGQGGIVHVYRRGSAVSDLWALEQSVDSTNNDVNDGFAHASLSNSGLLVGVPFEDSNATGIDGDATNNDLSNSGAAYFLR